MKNRNPFVVALLGYITLGFYELYWLAKTRSAIIKQTGQKIPSIWLLIVPTIVALGFYVLAFLPYFAHLQTNGQRTTSNLGIYFAGITLGGLILTAIHLYWFLKYAKAVDTYTQGKMSTGVTFVLLYILNVIGIAIIQDAFNNQDNNQENASVISSPVE